MKICVVNSFFPPWRGGAETYTHELSKSLVSRGHQVSVVCTADPLEPGTSDVDGVQIRRLRQTTRIYGTPIMEKLRETLLEMDANILHANFPSPYIAYSVARVSSQRRVPAVLTWHNDLPAVTIGAGILIEMHDRLVLPYYIRKYRRVISTTETYVRHSRILSKLGSQVTVVPNGVDCEKFNPRNDRAPIRYQFDLRDRFTLLFVAALTKWHGYKGLDTLLAGLSIVLKKGLDPVLLVVGDGSLKENYRQLAQRLNIQRSVVFAGDAPDWELPLYYAAADTLVLPSKNMSEGFGLTLLEANATGLPVIATCVGGVPSVVKDGYNGLLVRPNDPPSMADAICRMITDHTGQEEMGRNGRRVAEAHDWKIVASKTEQVYRDAIASAQQCDVNVSAPEPP
jgi:glycosyltransferase involved in cell wall biosynthesis